MLYEALSLPGELRIDALNIQKQLEPFRKKLRDAGAFYLKYFNDSQRSITVSALVSEYLGMQAKLGRSAVHLKDLRHRYKNFCADFGTSLIRVLEPEPIESWLHGLELSRQSVNNYRARLH